MEHEYAQACSHFYFSQFSVWSTIFLIFNLINIINFCLISYHYYFCFLLLFLVCFVVFISLLIYIRFISCALLYIFDLHAWTKDQYPVIGFFSLLVYVVLFWFSTKTLNTVLLCGLCPIVRQVWEWWVKKEKPSIKLLEKITRASKSELSISISKLDFSGTNLYVHYALISYTFKCCSSLYRLCF